MKKIILALVMVFSVLGITQPTQAQTFDTYAGIVFKDEVNEDQYNELSRTVYLSAVRAKKFEGKVIAYSHIKLPNDKYYSRTVYLAKIREFKGEFLTAINDLAKNGKTAEGLNLVKGLVTDEGEVVPAEEPTVKEFKVVDIK
ncbi:hypothetical protein [Caryophanon latum]|uniref:NEAT domain-containing protein n=1 Tax=Caryophanon latum TaxID=33977 RepID=A0A1C0YM83_9BACL|nr:hypothetical protein [Caryophanon latum]OCS88258.1 hypothetical protein A6K76_13700 [Caryophanon latum]